MYEAFLIWLYLSLSGLIYHIGIIMFWFSAAMFMILCILWFISLDDKDTKNRSHELDEQKTGAEECNIEIQNGEEFRKNARPKFKYAIMGMILGGIVYHAVPTDDELKYIIGGALVWNGIEATGDLEGVRELPQNLVDAANHFLEESTNGDQGED